MGLAASLAALYELGGTTRFMSQGCRMRTAEQPQWPFVGTWRLVSFESRDEDGNVEYPFGRDVAGQLSYDANGNMSALVARANVPHSRPPIFGAVRMPRSGQRLRAS